ncbi:MAG TPA: DinB family protein [Bryobacteraceae bacterium]|nr:DinB family protein [Bryobacteraceae bacterium]
MRAVFQWTILLAAPVLAAAQGQTMSPAISPVRQDLLNVFSSTASRCVTLAKAIPQDKLPWRPMEGVRSFNEVFVHMAGSTLLFGSYLGLRIPQGPAHDLATVYMKRGFEMPEIFASEAAIKDKAKIVEVMQQAFDQARELIRNMPDSDLDKTVDFFGRPTSERALLVILSEHLGEHLGQAIAYSRVNHIVPPWSEPKK